MSDFEVLLILVAYIGLIAVAWVLLGWFGVIAVIAGSIGGILF